MRKKPMTLSEFARSGGKARMNKLTKEQKSELGKKAIRSRWAKKKAK